MRHLMDPGPAVLFISLLLSVPGRAQTKAFSTDPNTFLQEVTDMMVGADKKEGKPFMEEVFGPVWNGAYYDDAQKGQVIDVANGMLKKRFQPYPDFLDYLSAVAAFANGGRSSQEFSAWMQSMDAVMKSGRKKNFADFISMCGGLFRDNAIYQSASTKWQAGSKAFTFAYDTVPKVVFPKMDLRCLAKGDSTVIHGTSGVYFPTQQVWRGRGGKVTWERAGLRATATFAEWDGRYEIKMKSSAYEVDSVHFNDPYFERTLLGRLSDKVLANVDEDNASYPRFESYDRRMHIRDIVEGVDFEGGFSMQGAKLQGYGTRDEPAFLTFYREGKPFIITFGLFYSIEPERITSEDVAVRIHLANDSIFHQSVSLRFQRDKRQLSLIKKEEGLSKAPFYDTFHKLDMYFEVLKWRQGDPLVELGTLQGSSQNRASFESFNFFKEQRYDAMLGIDAVHPLSRLNDFAKQAGNVFTAQDFAVFTRLQKSTVVPMLIDMANKGYLDYDVENEVITIQPRLRQHILSSAGKVDYDVLQFNSNSPDGVNASLNLLNNDLTLKGVARVIVSDSQDVKIYPSERTVVVKKDRDFTFGGMVQAGKLQFHGKEYYFHYDPFVIDLLNVDSVSFYADSFELDDQGRSDLVRVKNVLENVTGSLEIDQPSNKSGLLQEKYPEFPKFNSTKESFVFYDSKRIQKGVYDRDRFYYRSDPFQIDSLDNFTNAGLYFDGTLVSAGIFPDIREPLRLQKDYSLGFERYTGDGGLALYGKRSKFANMVSLNYDGLQGEGELAYLTTIANSKHLIFCPDSTFGVADTLYNAAGSAALEVPNVQGADVFVKLEPALERLHAQVTRDPMVMYDAQAFLYGGTDLTPKGMTGAGLVDFTNATLRADLFKFHTMQLQSDTSDFRLTEGDTASIAFRTNNVNATVKLDERVGEFVSNGDETKVEFPVNQYICYMDRFKWYMDQGDIELESDRTAEAASEDLQLSGSNFISIRPDQDSLSFMAPKARYDLKKHLITANEVQYIQVADALITPDSMRVRIRKNAEMDPLTNTVITANYVTKYHRIYDATVSIKAKRQYNGSGIIDYVDENKKAFPIHLQNINVDTAYQTYALGRVREDDGFQLSPAFDYFGDVKMEASIKELTFTGSTRIQHGCTGLPRNWMGFKGRIDPLEVFIPVGDSLRDDQGLPIGNGVFLTNDDPFRTYGTFLSRKKDKKDVAVISAKGLLFYDKAKKQYMISNKEKILQADLPGDLVSLGTEDCRIRGDGRIHSGLDLGRVDLDGVGTLEHLPEEALTMGEVVMLVNFFFHDNALERMAEEINAYPDAKQVDITKTPYERALREVLGLDRSDKLISELSLKGEIKRLPDELVKSLVLCDVGLKWDNDEQSWTSDGPIGIATVLKKPVFRYVKGKIELQRKRSGDSMTILLMLDDQTYYFFQYTRNYLYAYSSDQQFDTMLNELKEDKMSLEGKKDQPPYRYILTNKRKVDEFRDRYGL
ncbi:MAG: hypothetical protein H6595_11360 [Flavobacteriales bacterium]|nr:hypothetical protein [Flavobacteriales bacterium]MCB9168057.1 hypothetical protein [Flavobacteriales bacterium]